MHTPPLDPFVADAASLDCRHMRLVDRIFTETGQETDKVRCAECGAILADNRLRPHSDGISDHL